MPEFESEIAIENNFYEKHYDHLVPPFILRPGQKIVLGRSEKRICRFCQRSEVSVSFRMDAHAIPQSLGNKVLFSNYECDNCNQFFGSGIENDLGNWSKPSRTLARIRGKKGVPTIKKMGSEQSWRIEYGADGLVFKEFEDETHFFIDEERKRLKFKLQRDPYTPIAVFKAFVRIALTIMPESNLRDFADALSWIKEKEHSRSTILKYPVLSTFVPGPMPSDHIFVALMKRQESASILPYAFMILGYGNNVFQIFLPCLKYDEAIRGRALEIPPFARPYGPDPDHYGQPRTVVLDLCGREKVEGECVSHEFSFESIEAKD